MTIHEDTKTDIVPDRGSVRLWTVSLTPPLVWGLHLQICYALHASVCEAQSPLKGYIVSAVALAILAVSAIVSWRLWHSWPPPDAGGAAGWPEEKEPRWRGRARFMAASAFVSACYFALMIAGQTVPLVILRPCD
jgi:hypothetical protein